MTAHLIKIGNSQGIRIPSTVLKQYQFGEDIELTLRDDGILISPQKPHPRAGWAEDAKRESLRLTKEDRVWLDAPLSAKSDKSEWTWE